MVIGNVGGGKSTLSRAISVAHGLPHLAVDQIQWRPGWKRTPKTTFDALHREWLDQSRWVIDGWGSWDSIQQRLAAADTIVLVDHPFRVHVWWALKRQVKSLFRARPDGPLGCPMWRVTIPLFRMMWALHKEWRGPLIQAINARRGHARIIHIRSPRVLAEFAANPV